MLENFVSKNGKKKKKKKEAGFGISRGGQAAFSFFSHTAISMANFFKIAMDHYFSLNLFLPFLRLHLTIAKRLF